MTSTCSNVLFASSLRFDLKKATMLWDSLRRGKEVRVAIQPFNIPEATKYPSNHMSELGIR